MNVSQEVTAWESSRTKMFMKCSYYRGPAAKARRRCEKSNLQIYEITPWQRFWWKRKQKMKRNIRKKPLLVVIKKVGINVVKMSRTMASVIDTMVNVGFVFATVVNWYKALGVQCGCNRPKWSIVWAERRKRSMGIKQCGEYYLPMLPIKLWRGTDSQSHRLMLSHLHHLLRNI